MTDMKTCVQCGAEVSPLAKSCPKCGQPNPAQPKWATGAAVVGQMLLLLGVLAMLAVGGVICAAAL